MLATKSNNMGAKLDWGQIFQQLKRANLEKFGRWEPTYWDLRNLSKMAVSLQAWEDWQINWFNAKLEMEHISRTRLMKKMYGLD